MRFNLWKYSTLSLVLFLAICIACSSKLDSNNHSSQNPDPDLQTQAKMLQAGTTHAGGFHYMGQNATTKTSVAFKWGLIPKVYAQTVTTISYTGSYTGRCQMLSSEHQENGLTMPSWVSSAAMTTRTAVAVIVVVLPIGRTRSMPRWANRW